VKLQLSNYEMIIDGRDVTSSSGKRIVRQSPAHGVDVSSYPDAELVDVESAIAAARRAFDDGPWPRFSGAQRARVLRDVAAALERNIEHLAFVEVVESGKPITQATAEMRSVAELWWFAATLAQHAYGDAHNALGEHYLALTLREPVGVVGMITPWNFPLLILSQKLPFALAVGCTAVVKPSQLTSGTSLLLARMLRDAGIPDGVVNVVSGSGRVGAMLSSHPHVDMVTFTGSTEIGRAVAVAAAPTVKKVALELGGKNPMVVLADANLEEAADATVFGVFFNQGECCNSSSRVIVAEGVAEEFEERVKELTAKVVVGDPLDPATQVGAIASDEQFGKIGELVGDGLAAGAKLIAGGHPMVTEVGRFFEPTVFTGVTSGMSIATDEIFGPVLSVLRCRDLDGAIALANDTEYGLSAGIWTSDMNAATEFAKRARTGTVWVNCWMDGFPEVSFGGAKQSGLGRELGRHSIEEFTELKTITMHTGARTPWVGNGDRS
jgi:betaine-aldehyde dehydrogenase